MFAKHRIDGEGVSLAGGAGLTLDDADAIERYRDMLMLKHRALGLTYKQIGSILGMGHGTVHRRVKAIPESVKRLYAKEGLGTL